MKLCAIILHILLLESCLKIVVVSLLHDDYTNQMQQFCGKCLSNELALLRRSRYKDAKIIFTLYFLIGNIIVTNNIHARFDYISTTDIKN